MTIKWKGPKDPNERKDYDLSWVPLLVDGDTLLSSTWTVETDDTTLNIYDDSFTDTVCTVWVEAGETSIPSVDLLNRVTTAGWRTYDQTMNLKIKDK